MDVTGFIFHLCDIRLQLGPSLFGPPALWGDSSEKDLFLKLEAAHNNI
jgi:hypothetical protein